jgi:NADPH:quinone reductase-like Zn-dependent oxidoreductase
VKAIVGTEYGSPEVLQLREVGVPEVGDDQVLIRVRAASVNPLDWHTMRGEPYLIRLMEGIRRPKSPVRGADAAGIVEAVGANVTRFRPGDEVFGTRTGAFAELALGSDRSIAPKPGALTFEQAAAIPVAGCTALQALRDKGRIESGQQVLINGAAGGVGTFAVQIAKAFGAEVTGVCSTRNVELVRSIGAEHTVDYTHEDFTRSERRYDLILDAIGNRSVADHRRALAAKGTLVYVGAPPGNWIGPLVPLLKSLVLPRVNTLIAKVTSDDLSFLGDLAQTGKLTPVIDRTYPLAETADAIRYLEQGHAQGKVVITL